MIRRILSLVLVLGFGGISLGEEKPKPDAANMPVEITITGKTTKYTLDTGGLSSADYKKKLEDAKGKPGPTPEIDLTLEIKNTSDKPVKVWVSGDPVVLSLELKGKGAVNASPGIGFDTNFLAPNAVVVEAGKTTTIPLKSLTSGFRSAAKFSYWTEPGEHELVATLWTGISPAPKGSKEGMDGFGVVTLKSVPFKVTVEEKK